MHCRVKNFIVHVTDCHMPIMDGLTAALEIRALEKAAPSRPRLFIAAVSADAVVGSEAKYLAAGMDAFLSKPFTLEAVRDLLALAAKSVFAELTAC